jgi:hypothetical protein
LEEIMSRVPANTETKVTATLSELETSLVREGRELLIPVKRVTDEQIASAIRYLDPDPAGSERSCDDGTVPVICFSLLVLLIGALAIIWLFLQTSG